MEPSIRTSKITPRKLMRPSKSNNNNNSEERDNLSKSSNISSESTINELSAIDLAKYCTKDLFYIYLVNENHNSASETVHKLIETSQEYEDISCVTFVDRKDVLNLLDFANRELFSPSSLKPLLARIIHTIDSSIIPLLTEVQLVKMKLIQVMYQKYVKEVKKNEQERNLETLLNTLTKECRKKHKKEDETENKAGQPKEIKKPKKEDKLGKDTDQNEEFDYTTIPLNKDDVTYEENIFNYVWFFCLTGFNNPDIIQGLIEQINVPIEGIIKVCNTKENNKSETEESFWNRIKHDFFDNTSSCKFLERTILLQFIPTNDDDNALNLLEEFIFMLRKFLNVKLTYLKYIRHLKLNRIKHSYGKMPLECFSSYNRALRNIPPECVNSAIILDGLLKEISIRNDESLNSTNFNSLESLICTKPSKSVHCMDPLYDLNAFFPQTEYPAKVDKIKSFLTHEENVLLKTLKSYNRVGDQVMYTTLNLLKLQKTLLGFDDFPTLNYDISHLHDKNPSEELDVLKSDDKIENFLLTFIFNKIINEAHEPSSEEIDVILKNLITFNANEYFKIMQAQHEEDVQCDDENLYNTSVAHFRWKEFLNKDLLFQEIFKASEEFLYTTRKFSPETDNFFLIFSDKLDAFGLNTRMYNIILRTPICFRDFCRYITVKDTDWLENNKNEINAETFKVVFKEKCPGVEKVKTQMKIFQEYSYLLDEDINENEIVDEVEVDRNDESLLKSQELFINSEITFEDILNDLKTSSSNDLNLLEECENAPPEKQLLAYNLGSNIFKLNGKIITFCSHDGVKVTVDNSRFLQSPEKCTFNLSHNENCVTLHSSESMLKNPYIIKIKLKDDTRISLISSCAIIQKDNNRTQNNSTINEAEQEIVNVIYNEVSEETGQSEEPELNEKTEDILQIAVDPTPVPVVHYIEANQLEELLKEQSFDDLSTNEDYDDLMVSLINATENNGTIYKVYAKNNFLERRNSNFQIPLANALKRIISIDNFIPKSSNKLYEKFTKRYAPASRPTIIPSSANNNNNFDFRICLPNGLYIRPYNCVVDKSTLMIKQEYSEEKPCISSLEHEEFRLYSNEGSVIVKKVDGTITIYKANGDLINFEKPTTTNNELNFNNNTGGGGGTYCHCTTIDDYRNKLNKLLKDQENSDCSTSRRAHITSKQNHILDDKVLKILEEFKVPFVKKSILRFDGKRIKIQGDKITQKQQYHLTSSQDFLTGEIHYERSDDFRSVFYKNGSQKIMFSDGTIISNSIDVAEELVDDFVYIKMNYRYEHPYYATVGFNFDKTVVVKLNNEVILEEKPEKCGFKVKIEPDDLQVSISHENAFVKKSCSECLEEFEATFHIKSFKDSIWNPTDEFMHIKDSYNKHFYSDYLGNCSRNNDYVIGGLNVKNCNHFKKNQYKKLFIVNKDYRGAKISTNDYVKNKIKQFENNNLIKKTTTVETYCMMENENITVVDCREKFFNKFSDRFFNIEILKNPINEYYTTFRVFHKMFESVDDIQNHVSNMWEIFFHEKLEQINYAKIYDDVATLANITEAYYIKNKKELLAEAKESSGKRKKYLNENEKKKYNLKCSCAKQIMSMEEKMLQWKNECKKYRKLIKQKKIPPYFKSPFCKNI